MSGSGRTRINREARVSEDARSDSWRVYDCQTVGVYLTIPGDLGAGKDGAQTTKRENLSESELAFQHHFSGRSKRETVSVI